MSKRRDREYVADMLIACERILKYTWGLSYEEFRREDMVVDAVVRNLEILGEAVKNVSESLKEKYPDIEWRDIARTLIKSYIFILVWM